MIYFLSVVSIALSLISGTPGNGKPIAQDEASTRCPMIYAPVTCSNGKTYPNQCVADQHRAKNCVPTGGI